MKIRNLVKFKATENDGSDVERWKSNEGELAINNNTPFNKVIKTDLQAPCKVHNV